MERKKRFRLALIGSDSLRGKEIKNILNQRDFPLEDVGFFDPDVTEEFSKLTQFRGEPKVIHSPNNALFQGIDLLFLASEKQVNKKYGQISAKKKVHAIDLNETFNADRRVPLIVCGVNEDLLGKKKYYLIANPHPVTIILSHLFHVLLGNFGIEKALAVALQPVSVYEEEGIDELAHQSMAVLGSSSVKKSVFNEQIAFNLLSHTGRMDGEGFSPVERQIVSEIKRVFQDKPFPFSLSMVQAPVFHTYAIMAYLELKNEADLPSLKNLFKASSLFKLSTTKVSCSVSSVSVAGKDDIFIGQIKKDRMLPKSFWVWTVADNLTRGSAVNAYEITNKILLNASS